MKEDQAKFVVAELESALQGLRRARTLLGQSRTALARGCYMAGEPVDVADMVKVADKLDVDLGDLEQRLDTKRQEKL